MISNDTIVALSTPQGVGALAVIRLSGDDAITVANKIFKGENLSEQASHTLHYGHIMDGGEMVDEVMVSIFLAPKSFTTENMVEISCHGSPYIAEQIIRLLLQSGARAAKPGEFTLRAFMHGRIDLAQAEAVADLIASDSSAAHQLAINQLRGGFSKQIKELRHRLVDLASLIELELDFAEEDVVFANRQQLLELADEIAGLLKPMSESFKLGNAIKHGVNTVIIGKPNAGKSTLLNALLNEERALVSATPGTTRDTIEEVLHIKGVAFRFIDTAGLRSTGDAIEQAGVNRALEKLRQSTVYIYLFDVNTTSPEELLHDVKELGLTGFTGLIAGNKIDLAPKWSDTSRFYWTLKNNLATHDAAMHERLVFISAHTGKHIEELKEKLYSISIKQSAFGGESTIISNMRHYEALNHAFSALEDVKNAISNKLSGELISVDLKRALGYLGQLSGEVTNDEILGNIFGKFCIGK